jgi:hypothetical protein
MLDLPWLCATVNATVIGTDFELVSLCANDIDNPLPWSSDDNHDQCVALLTGLIRRGIIDGELSVEERGDPRYCTTLHCRYLPAPWFVRNPQYTARVNAVYESRYPGALARLGIPTEVGTHPDKWIDWLTTS